MDLRWLRPTNMILILAAGLLIYFAFIIFPVLIPFFLGLILAYVLNPVVTFVNRGPVTRMEAIVLVYTGLSVLLIALGVFGVPNLLEELERLAQTVPDFTELLLENVELVNQRYRRINIPAGVRQIIDDTIQRFEDYTIEWVRGLTGSFFNLFSHLLSLILAPILSFYMLKDRERIIQKTLALCPGKKQESIVAFFRDIDRVVGGFIRGQLLVSLIVGVLTAIGLVFLEVKFALVLGVTAGLFNIIPYFGPILGALPAIAVALISSPFVALNVLVLFVVIQQLESSLLAPNIIGEKVGLHPLLIIFSLLVGGKLFGFFGLLFGIPVVGIIKVAVEHFLLPCLQAYIEEG